MVQTGGGSGEPDGGGGGSEEPDRDGQHRPPADLRVATREAFGTRAANTDVADIVYDSLVDAGQPGPADGRGRELRFARGETSVRLAVAEHPDRPGTSVVTLLLTPPRSVKVEVRGGNGPFSVDVDAGRAVFEVASRRLVTLVVPPATPGGLGVQTAFVRL